jgi:hypothetical protein
VVKLIYVCAEVYHGDIVVIDSDSYPAAFEIAGDYSNTNFDVTVPFRVYGSRAAVNTSLG